MKLEFLDRFSKNAQILNFTKIRPVEAELYHAGGETDGHGEANSRYSQSCNVPKNARCVVIFKVLCFLRPSRRDAGSLASCWFISYRIISVMNSTKRKKMTADVYVCRLYITGLLDRRNFNKVIFTFFK